MSEDRSHITPEQYQKYLNGELSDSEAYEIERLLQSTPLYNEAMDGLEKIDLETLVTDLSSLKEQIPLPSKKKQQKSSWLKIAAMVALLIVGIPVLWLFIDQQQSNLEVLSDKSGKEMSEDEPKATESITHIPLADEPEVMINGTDDQKVGGNVDAKKNDKQDQKPIEKEYDIQQQRREVKSVAAAPAPVADKEIIEEDALIDEVIVFSDDIDTEVAEESVVFESVKAEERSKNLSTILKEEEKRKKIKKANTRSIAATEKTAPASDKDLSDSMGYFGGTTDNLNATLVADSIVSNFSLTPTYLYPVPADGQKSFEDYLKDNDILLKKKRRYQPVSISFLVQQDSTVANIQLIEGDSFQFDQISKIILDGPKWIPADNLANNRIRLILWKNTEKK